MMCPDQADVVKPAGADEPSATTCLTPPPQEVQTELSRMTLMLIELLRRLIERQALNRTESGSPSDPRVQRLSAGLASLSEQMNALRKELGLEGDQLTIDLGALGKLL